MRCNWVCPCEYFLWQQQLLLYRLGQLVDELFVEPDAFLAIHVQTIVGMPVRCWRVVFGKRTGAAIGERAEDVLLGVIEPDQPVTINADAGGMFGAGLAGNGVGVF